MRYPINLMEATRMASCYSLAKLYSFRARWIKAGRFDLVALADAAIERKLSKVYGEAQA